MIVFVQAYLGGVLTSVSPRILPALPFVFCESGPSVDWKRIADAHRNGSDGRVGCDTGGCCRRLGRPGEPIGTRAPPACFSRRWDSQLLCPLLAKRLSEPFVVFAVRLSETADDGTAAQGATVVSSIARGVATGFVSAPCAGLVRGLNLTGAPLLGRVTSHCCSPSRRARERRWRGRCLSARAGPHRTVSRCDPRRRLCPRSGYRLTHSLSAKGAHQ
jgi:hypothetical protein